MIKKLIAMMMAACLMFAPVTASAAELGSLHSNTTTIAAVSRGFSSHFGGSTYRSSRSYSSRPYTAPRSYSYSTPRYSGFGSHLFSFGTGFLLGGLFHPFGGYYGPGYYYHPFSFFNFLIDIVLVVVIISILRRLFWRR